MDFTPRIKLVASLRNNRLGWHDCVAELIDNAFDAGAARAVLQWGGRSFSIEDDGRGIPKLETALQLGGHERHSSTALGCYGVGLKDAWHWMSDGIAIVTTHEGTTTEFNTRASQWEQIDGRWIGPDPTTRPATKGEHGTKLTFSPLHAGRNRATIATLSELGVTFMPAINSGKQIVIVNGNKRQPLVPYRIPAMQESIEETFDVDGKQVSIVIGIAQEGEKITKPGFLFCYKHRVIKSSTFGTKNFSAARMVGKVVLGQGWVLTPHKNDFADHSDELEDGIYSRILPLLRKEDQMSTTLESTAIRLELQGLVNESLNKSKRKEKRPGERTQQGTVMSTGTGRKRRKASVIDTLAEGSVEVSGEGKGRTGLVIKWVGLGEELIGRCEVESRAVLMNIENDFVARMKAAGNVAALFAVAIGLICHADDTMDGPQQKMLIPKGGFGDKWGRVMSELRTEENANAR